MSDLQARLGAALAATYTIERELGGGGMSRVFLARETALDRRVVIKTLPPELEGEVSADRFRREIALAARLQHPTIVPLLAAGEADGLLYYTMPFIEGTSLRMELDRSGALAVDRATRIVRDVLEALSYAHAHGVIHRDIKPENVLLAPHHAVVTDFGVAKALDAAGTLGTGGRSTAGLVIGSPAYMAPEQAAADPTIDHRADLYSVGVMAYEMLAGGGPYGKRSPSQFLAAHIAEKPVPVTSKRKDVPEPLGALVMRLLEKSPADRPQSADEALAMLDGSARITRSWKSGRAMRIGSAVAAAALVGIGVARWKPWARAGTNDAAPSVAVMRFADRSPKQDEAYLSDGISEELIGALSRVRGLRVIGRASSFRLTADSLSAKEIGDRLNVRAVLEGSVQREGDKLRVVASLVDAPTSRVLWQETYDRDLKNVFTLEDELATAIVSTLSAQLVVPDSGAARTRAIDPAAYQLYLQGRYLWNKRTADALRKSVVMFDSAIAIDSEYARAYAGLADAWNVLGGLSFEPALTALPKAKAAAMKALALDPGLADAHAALGFVFMFDDWNWDGARQELERAIALDPNYSTARLYHAFYLQCMGERDRSIEEVRRGLASDPLSLILNLRLGNALRFAHRYPEALAQFRRLSELDSAFMGVTQDIVETWAVMGEYQKALDAYQAGDRPGHPYVGGQVVYLLAKTGRPDSARKVLAALQRFGKVKDEYDDWDFLIAYTAVGQYDSALVHVGHILDERGTKVVGLTSEPMIDGLRADPGFVAALRRVGLPAMPPPQ